MVWVLWFMVREADRSRSCSVMPSRVERKKATSWTEERGARSNTPERRMRGTRGDPMNGSVHDERQEKLLESTGTIGKKALSDFGG